MDSRSRASLDKQRAVNPCFDESSVSQKCLDKYGGAADRCKAEIANYKNCKTFWYDISQFRRINGIRPSMPEAADRPKIKENFMEHRNLDATCAEMLAEHRRKEADKA